METDLAKKGEIVTPASDKPTPPNHLRQTRSHSAPTTGKYRVKIEGKAIVADTSRALLTACI